MMRNKRYSSSLLLCSLLTLAFSAAQARAGFVTYDVNVGAKHSLNVTIDATTHSGAWVGEINLTNPNPAANGIPYDTVCTDINGTLYVPGKYSFTPYQFAQSGGGIAPSWGAGNAGQPRVSPPNTQPNANAVAAIQNAADIFYNNLATVKSFDDADHWAALQLAVWEALYDSSASGATLSLSDGRFRAAVSGNTLTLANAMIQSSGNFVRSRDYLGDLLYPDISNPNSPPQALLYQVTPVPEPTTLIAGVLLLLPFAASTLRRFRKG
ncbi:MAG: hypothetical protein AB9869_13865 [Verrucomicrobiia bacterium]